MLGARRHQPRENYVVPVLVFALLLLMGLSALAAGAEVRYVGNITGGPQAPTSLSVNNAGIGALEPYARQLEVFTADGTLQSQVEISGEARGLAHLRDQVYLFCDLDAGSVASLDLSDGRQSILVGNLGQPVDLVVSGSEIFVLDGERRTIVACTGTGVVTDRISLPVPTGIEAGWLADLAYDDLRQVFHVLDQTHSRILTYGRDGSFQKAIGGFGTHDGEWSRGGEITCDPDGWIYVTDRYQGRVVVFDANGSFVVNVDPVTLGQDRLLTPTGFAVDPEGFLYVAATEGAAIHIFHLDKSTASTGDLLARPASPGPGDDMRVDDLHFVASVQVPVSHAAQSVVDFRLFSLDDPHTPVAEISDVPLVGGTVIGNIVVGSVSWRPSAVLTEGQTYGWQARARAGAVEGAWMAMSSFVPSAAVLPFRLEQNTPNPFNPRTVIVFSLKDESRADLNIYDIRGSQVWSADLSGFGPGKHQVVWEGQDKSGSTLPSGVYFYRLVSGTSSATKKMVLMR